MISPTNHLDPDLENREMEAFSKRIRSWSLRPSLSGTAMILNAITVMIVCWTWSMIGQQKTENERTVQFLRDNRHVQVGEWMWVHSKLLSLRDSIGYQEDLTELLSWSSSRVPSINKESLDEVRKWVKHWESSHSLRSTPKEEVFIPKRWEAVR